MSFITGPDVSSHQLGFSYAACKAEGHQVTYVKLGGDNIPRYCSDSYPGFVDDARAHGFKVGHYWVTGGHDPEAAARFFLDHLHNVQPGDFFVLDNEDLDDGNVYTDDEAARWIGAVQKGVGGAPARVIHYGNQSFMNSHAWPKTLATGCNFIIANYNNRPFNLSVGTIPFNRVVGHQYTDNASTGGKQPVDMNAFDSNLLQFTTTASVGAATTIQGDDMPSHETTIYTDEALAWSEGKFHHLPVTTRAASYDIAKGPEVGTVIVDLALAGLPKGREAQVRICTYVNGKRTASLGATEIVGTSGQSLGQHVRQYDIAAGESIRAELCVFDPGVTVERISHSRQHWN